MKVLKRVLKWITGAILVLLLLALVAVFIAYWRSTNDCKRYTAAPANAMKAVVYCDYGKSNLNVADVEKPVPNDDQVLVKIRASSVNPYDWHFIEGTPKIMRLGVGLRKPKETRLGVDYAGTVEAVGKNVTQFKPGDEVFGGRSGAFAQYVCVRQDRLIALKPANITFDEAGAVDIAGVTALQAVRDKAKLLPGQKVLINGASGGVGTFAVQIAKSLGADVTGVCSTRNIELVRSLGADHVIDYTKEDFTKNDQRYDVIFDNVQNHTFSERRRVLTPNGICVLAGLGGAGWHADTQTHMIRSFTTPLMSKFTSQKFSFYIAQLNHQDLALLADLMQSGKVTPVIDRTYKSLGEVRDALQYLEQGHARGKVVITVE